MFWVISRSGLRLLRVSPVRCELHPEPLNVQDVVLRDEEAYQCPMRSSSLRYDVGSEQKMFLYKRHTARVGVRRSCFREGSKSDLLCRPTGSLGPVLAPSLVEGW